MTETEISVIVRKQRAYLQSGVTLDVEFRLRAISRMKAWIRKHEQEISEAIEKDLGKSAFESYMCETGMTLSEISYMQKHTRAYAREKTVRTPLTQFHARSFTKPSPYGVVLIMSPWNYPFMLAMEPLVDALAAGNTVILKPSAYSPNTSALIVRLVKACFDESYVAVITGGRAEHQYLLQEHFDYIFFTGSKAVGREVMRQASDHLTPVTLELGGKSPCIVDRSANLKLAARRIVFGKYLNCGQTCVAPDYVYCDPTIRDELIANIRIQIKRQFGENPLQNKDYGKIINRKHYDRICGLIDPAKVVIGGNVNPDTLQIEPTVMDDVTFGDPVMQEEIFGPILPVLTYDSLDDAVRKINSMEHPLALYLFTSSKGSARMVMSKCGFGGGCINDTIIHLATSEMGFGGFGESGMGAY
ncbi:MAG: aldehyde dehydrogenase, partial [Lachnospiraceae bacterium]|nr:aldehyde dehydrogenase [Lachnospiraceae bacterium]